MNRLADIPQNVRDEIESMSDYRNKTCFRAQIQFVRRFFI